MAITLRVDPVLAEMLDLRAAPAGSTPGVWLSALLSAFTGSSHRQISVSTMGKDSVSLYQPVEGLPFHVPARLSVDLDTGSVVVREIEIADGELTYCGLVDPLDAFFDAPMLVAHRQMALPQTLLTGLAGSPVGTVIETGAPILDRRAIASARVTDFGLMNARMGWKGEETATVELRLAPSAPVEIRVEVPARAAAPARQV